MALLWLHKLQVKHQLGPNVSRTNSKSGIIAFNITVKHGLQKSRLTGIVLQRQSVWNVCGL